MAPRMIWPSAPMLNRPALNGSATPSPATMRGAATVSVSVMGLMACWNDVADAYERVLASLC